MMLVREIMHCKPGKVRPLLDKFLAMNRIMEKSGMGKMRIMTDIAGERYWTLVSEMEVESLDQFMSMAGMSPEDAKEFEKIMQGYHDLVDFGRRELYKIEG
jgi:hypothetical protein